MGMHRALALHPSPQGPRWLAFDRPLAVHEAHDLDDVSRVVAAAEAAAGVGRWVVLVVAYDASPAFEPAMVAHRHPSAPLAVAGVFDRPRPVAGPRPAAHRVGPWTSTLAEADHAAAVERARAHIADGDVYQLNLTSRLMAGFEGDPEGLFTSLFRAQGTPYAAYVELDGGAICSASPELLVSRRGDRLVTKPMKGTAARSVPSSPAADRAAVAALVASPKERAENTMIVDVARNDLGRVARRGSVVVDRLHAVEHYPTLHQMTSTVRADTDAGLGAVLGALFPAASITGAPKVRATQLIAELEGTARGVYCGTVGVLGPAGWQLNVAIRTAWVDRVAGTVEYGVGGGIVWDSRPSGEWAELEAKAAILRGGPPTYELLETMRWEPGTGLLAADRHRRRLLDSAAVLGFDVREAELAVELDAALAAPPERAGGQPPRGPSRVRVLVDAAGSCRVEVGEAPTRGTIERPAGPWRAALAAAPVRADDLFCWHKTTHRVAYEQARLSRADVDDVVCWNEDGNLTETTVGNLVLELDGRLVTPRRAAGLLAGTTRDALLGAGTVVEADLVPDDLHRAVRCWTVNAVRGWVLLVLADEPAAGGLSPPAGG